MKQSWHKCMVLISVMMSLFLVSGLAEAKRMGGGRSMGKQSQTVNQKRNTQQSQQASTPAQQQTAQASPKRNWGGMLGGLAAGLGLGMLLSHFGGGAMMNGLANILMIAAVVMLGLWLVRKVLASKRANTQPAYAGGQQFKNNALFEDTKQPFSYSQAASSTAMAVAEEEINIPKDFDVDAFLRQAKVHFVRLQTAWDTGNTEDIREFTSPEMFAEIYTDLSTRDANISNQTDVITLDAQLLDVEQSDHGYMVSVKFSGMIRETQNAAAESFVEIWNLSKAKVGTGGWVLAGIQQVAEANI